MTKGDMLRQLMAQVSKIKVQRTSAAIPLFGGAWPARREHQFTRGMLLAALALPVDDLLPLHSSPVAYPNTVVLDPFAGSGTTLVESVRLSCQTIGFDINPLAAWLSRCRLMRVDMASLDGAFEQLIGSLQPLLASFHQTTCTRCGSEASVRAAISAWLHRCAACQAESLVLQDTLVVQRKDEHRYLCPRCRAVTTSTKQSGVTCAGCGWHALEQLRTAGRGTAICPACHYVAPLRPSVLPEAFIETLALIDYDCVLCGRQWKQPDERDYTLASQAKARWAEQKSILPVPTTALPNAPGYQRYGLHTFADLFTARQLLTLGSALQAIQTEPDEAIRSTLLVLFSQMVLTNSRLSRYQRRQGRVEAFQPWRTVMVPLLMAEGNPWSQASSTSWAYHYYGTLRPAKEQLLTDQGARVGGREVGWPEVRFVNSTADLGRGSAWIAQASASSLPLPDASVDVIVTDPPYYTSIDYSSLADLRYAWLRLALAQHDHSFASETATNSDEIRVYLGHSNPAEAVQAYERGLIQAFQEMARVLRQDGTMAYIFRTESPEDFVRVFGWMLQAGFMVTELWPLESIEQPSILQATTQERLITSSVFTCRKRGGGRPMAWDDFQQELLDGLQRRLGRLRDPSRARLVEVLWSGFIVQFSQSFPHLYKPSRERVGVDEAVRWMFDLVSITPDVTTNLSALAEIQEIRRRVAEAVIDEAEASDKIAGLIGDALRHDIPSIEADLRATIGEALWSQLEPETRRFLVSSEYLYRVTADHDMDHGVVAVGFAKPLEMELKGKFCRNLAAFGQLHYPASTGLRADKFKLTWERLADGATELGKVENLLRTASHPENQPLVAYLERLDPDLREYTLNTLPEVIKKFREEGRNPGAHTGIVARSVVDGLRSYVLGTTDHVRYWVAL